MNVQKHDRLGNVTILIESELNGKFYSLVKSQMIRKTKIKSRRRSGVTNDSEYGYQYRKNLIKSHYYVLWGLSEDLNTRGITHLATPTGKSKGPTTIVKNFMEQK